MSEKRRGLGRGLGALIPTGLDGQRPTGAERPVDVFFPDSKREAAALEAAESAAAQAVVVDAAAGGQAGQPSAPTAAATEGVGAAAVTGTLTEERPVDGASEEWTVESITQQTAAAGTDGPGTVADGTVADGTVADGTVADGTMNGGAAHDGAVADGAVHDRAVDDGTSLVPVPGARFAELPVLSIRPNPRQPRTVFDEDALDELVGSITEIGVLQPIVVRDVGDGYELIMGERRWRATQLAGLDTVPAIIRDTDDADLLRDALLENLHRSQLNPLEEAAAYQQLLDDFGCTHEELATRIHRSRPQISNTLRLLKLPPLVQRRVAAGVLSAGHARALLGLPDAAAQERLAQRIVAEGLSVRAVEEIVSLGGDPEQPARRSAPVAGQRNEALDNLAARLSDRFETRVKVSLGKSRGRLTVEFASVQDLNRILASLAPEDPGLLKG
ncbi:ParB/RepB/Spo0J family partition protein [Cellulomonas sp. URHD0024]|uniref:ParB/RepB/Spo0J family partition protein n=1 Tax=Cellulomonas sp. URHD0024 TaxID=1302620 RepID=UPI00040AEA51|nr:ParB/RepB/Spo0J family partition protein [Cellulomonas sp. URHD0024]